MTATNVAVGYNLSHQDAVAEAALNTALQIVGEITRDGSEMRHWTQAFRERVEDFFDGAITGNPKIVTIEATTRLETEMAERVRDYFASIAKGMVRLQVLNPPLDSRQLDPFLEAILGDRRRTMAEMECLSQYIERIRTLKTRLSVRPTY